MPGWSLSWTSWQVFAPSTLPPRDVIVPAQLPPVLPETMVFARKTVPSLMTSSPSLSTPPPDGATFEATVLDLSVSLEETRRPPPNRFARLPETVEFSTVTSPSPSANTPPPSSAMFPDAVERRTSSDASPTWWIAPPIAAVLPVIEVMRTTSGPSPRLSMPPPSPFAMLSRIRELWMAAVSPSLTALSPAYEIPPPPSSGESDRFPTTSIPTMVTLPDWIRMPPPASSAWFAEKRVPVIVTMPPPSFESPPPLRARLSTNAPPVTTTSPPEFECMPPPSPPTAVSVSTAAFFVNVELSTVTSPEPSFPNPPPFSPVFSVNVLEPMLTLPLLPFWIAPPQSPATFFVKTLSATLSAPCPLLEIAPPLLPWFSLKVLPVTLAGPSRLKIAPPSATARLFANSVSVTERAPAPSFEMPAPLRPLPARLSAMRDPLTVSVPMASSSALFAIAPAPTSESSRPASAAELLETIESVTVSAPPRLLLSALPASAA